MLSGLGVMLQFVVETAAKAGRKFEDDAVPRTCSLPGCASRDSFLINQHSILVRITTVDMAWATDSRFDGRDERNHQMCPSRIICVSLTSTLAPVSFVPDASIPL